MRHRIVDRRLADAEVLPADVRLKAVTSDGRLPFVFEASGSETHVTNGFDPEG